MSLSLIPEARCDFLDRVGKNSPLASAFLTDAMLFLAILHHRDRHSTRYSLVMDSTAKSRASGACFVDHEGTRLLFLRARAGCLDAGTLARIATGGIAAYVASGDRNHDAL